MSGLLLNVVLAFSWALFLGDVNLRNLVVGYALGFGVVALFRGVLGDRYVSRTGAALSFVFFFLRELAVANVQVALFALRPQPNLQPVIVAVPLRLQDDSSITFLAAAITLLPGTVAMGVSPDRKFLYAHAIGLPTLDAARTSIQNVEDRLLPFLK
ncbi:Na+/H+ antiporter subunit E [Deinococcus peraridilitoris]|uniref:Multisubunit Na+/H+ antiporter, MnhE subunit n=1 Tax=Deinococcus peraridilitoris (strain DSM 19664 / LMG 22246 / CIP 109416 / KR-200) TaxID=937777 RepID=L0A0H0_DEIPD|nr:Na+/H+ antiporter subunit E [Deinococcus peraridilitoris]AFZ66647.1 multisubunit Na+/H+ antiporter, MnhE subunit [Deinococcus peraridilitoris DSM 19664]